jgi:hypothetical protein
MINSCKRAFPSAEHQSPLKMKEHDIVYLIFKQLQKATKQHPTSE